MEHILDEIRATFDCGIWYPVVSSVLMLPDACGAVEFWDQAKRPRDRYIEWYDKWVHPHFHPPRHDFPDTHKFLFGVSTVYVVRNAMMHESTGFTRGKHGFDRVLFLPPNKEGMHYEFNNSSGNRGDSEVAFHVTILGLLNAVDQGVRNWLSEVRADEDRRRETALDKLLQIRPHGHSPHVNHVPVVS